MMVTDGSHRPPALVSSFFAAKAQGRCAAAHCEAGHIDHVGRPVEHSPLDPTTVISVIDRFL
jgi:hypothetical protein